VPKFREPKVGEATVEYALRVMNLAVSNKVNAIGDHGIKFTLR
jgi:hypothetical protein